MQFMQKNIIEKRNIMNEYCITPDKLNDRKGGGNDNEIGENLL